MNSAGAGTAAEGPSIDASNRLVSWARRMRSRALVPLREVMMHVAERGDLAARCGPLPRSDLSPLREAFDAMMERLERRERGRELYRRKLQASLAQREREHQREAQRTRELLDAIDQALIVVDRQGMPTKERNAVFDRWFGAPEPGQSFAQIIARASAEAGTRVAQQWQQLEEGILPPSLVHAQLPQTLDAYDGACYGLAYRSLSGEPGEATLVVISNLTASAERSAREQEQQSLLELLGRVSKDRASFSAFFDETELLLRRLVEEPGRAPAAERRELHTLRTNLRLFGLEELAELVSEVEAHCTLERGVGEDDRRLLAEAWERIAERVLPLLGTATERVEVDRQALSRLQDALRAHAPSSELEKLVTRLSHDSVMPLLQRMADGAHVRGKQLGSAPLRVLLDAEGVQTPPRLRWFWSVLPHLIDNAVEHGIERPEERAAAGKPSTATLRVQVRERGDVVHVEVEDDGRGIDWDALRARARHTGAAVATHEELVALLFAPGISSANSNGGFPRGMGLSALEAQCRRHGAQVEVRSEPGGGSCFRFTLPLTGAEPAAVSNRPVEPARQRRPA